MHKVKPEAQDRATRTTDAVILTLYSALLLAVLVIGLPYWLIRMLTSGRYRAGLAGRLGLIPDALRQAVSGKQTIWLHAVSVGEVLAATRLVEQLRTALPDTIITVSTTTRTGQELARRRFPGSPIFYIPLDLAFFMRRYLRLLRPRLVLLMESELWPNMIHQCYLHNIPLAVANARISDRSLPRYLHLRSLWKPRLEEVSVFLAQSEESAARLQQIGAPHVLATGNLKYDIRAGEPTPLVSLLRKHLPTDAPILICGSTLPGEDELLLAAWKHILSESPSAVLILAPRHPQRFDAVATLLQSPIRASQFSQRPAPIAPDSTILLDTIGDLATVYSLATVAFVGGSLLPYGGHNPLEPAQFGVPTLIGSSFENFREIVTAMQQADAIRIVREDDLAANLHQLLTKPDEAISLGERAKAFFDSRAGATNRTVAALLELIR